MINSPAFSLNRVKILESLLKKTKNQQKIYHQSKQQATLMMKNKLLIEELWSQLNPRFRNCRGLDNNNNNNNSKMIF